MMPPQGETADLPFSSPWLAPENRLKPGIHSSRVGGLISREAASEIPGPDGIPSFHYLQPLNSPHLGHPVSLYFGAGNRHCHQAQPPPLTEVVDGRRASRFSDFESTQGKLPKRFHPAPQVNQSVHLRLRRFRFDPVPPRFKFLLRVAGEVFHFLGFAAAPQPAAGSRKWWILPTTLGSSVSSAHGIGEP